MTDPVAVTSIKILSGESPSQFLDAFGTRKALCAEGELTVQQTGMAGGGYQIKHFYFIWKDDEIVASTSLFQLVKSFTDA